MSKLAIHEIRQRPGGKWDVRVTLPGVADESVFLTLPMGMEPSHPNILDAAERHRLHLNERTALVARQLDLGPPTLIPTVLPWHYRLRLWLATIPWRFWRR